eukprot:TRINITY_DN2473_c0_g1_i2.p1 TRINITY_DN2473_c0_g1~~TRINITY_DN2473_c0_g1_i2.p1  ORF type:complete len:359 (-),score=52.40 TRINITY_DN2473_c0_g1_i2:314-1390(-)
MEDEKELKLVYFPLAQQVIFENGVQVVDLEIVEWVLAILLKRFGYVEYVFEKVETAFHQMQRIQGSIKFQTNNQNDSLQELIQLTDEEIISVLLTSVDQDWLTYFFGGQLSPYCDHHDLEVARIMESHNEKQPQHHPHFAATKISLVNLGKYEDSSAYAYSTAKYSTTKQHQLNTMYESLRPGMCLMDLNNPAGGLRRTRSELHLTDEDNEQELDETGSTLSDSRLYQGYGACQYINKVVQGGNQSSPYQELCSRCGSELTGNKELITKIKHWFTASDIDTMDTLSNLGYPFAITRKRRRIRIWKFLKKLFSVRLSNKAITIYPSNCSCVSTAAAVQAGCWFPQPTHCQQTCVQQTCR